MSEDERTRHPVTRAMLPMHCPPEDSELWSAHPRVYLPMRAGEDVACPYCGAVFFLQDDEPGD